MKRLIDLTAAAVGIVVTSPLWVVAAIAIKLEDRGKILYRARRIGRDGVPFDVYKFRTMTPGEGLPITQSGDARITRVGGILRASKIDELPQLLNVVRGQMSLVGPRPEDPRYVASYSPEQRRVLSIRPGITGPAAIAYRHEERLLSSVPDVEHTYVTKVLPAKLQLDLEYVDNRTLVNDFRLLFRTLGAIVSRNDEPVERSNDAGR